MFGAEVLHGPEATAVQQAVQGGGGASGAYDEGTALGGGAGWARTAGYAARLEAPGGGAGQGAMERDVFPPPAKGQLTSQDEELRLLRRRVAVLEEERDILKATAEMNNPAPRGGVSFQNPR